MSSRRVPCNSTTADPSLVVPKNKKADTSMETACSKRLDRRKAALAPAAQQQPLLTNLRKARYNRRTGLNPGDVAIDAKPKDMEEKEVKALDMIEEGTDLVDADDEEPDLEDAPVKQRGRPKKTHSVENFDLSSLLPELCISTSTKRFVIAMHPETLRADSKAVINFVECKKCSCTGTLGIVAKHKCPNIGKIDVDKLWSQLHPIFHNIEKCIICIVVT
eukprot:scaffold105658_cov34-Cyclotella_meneghiniana.AAC.2